MNQLTNQRFCPFLALLLFSQVSAAQSPSGLIGSVPADLSLPRLEPGPPQAGKRVQQVLSNWTDTDVYHVLYLPTDYQESKKYPVIVEYAGNGGFRNSLGDESHGVPEGSHLGLGLSGGRGFIWLCLPFVNGQGTSVAPKWWGDPPSYDVNPTLRYCCEAVPWICENYGGDPDRVLLAGFSRGAIACNFIGLHNDEIAKLWCGFIAYSHYDGVRRWPYPHSDRESATGRLRRLGDRPQLICHETAPPDRGLAATRTWLESTGIEGSFTFVETGFRNHNDAWVLRPSDARRECRKWIEQFR